MTGRVRQPGCRWIGAALCLALGVFVFNASSLEAQPVKRLLHNEDETDFFWNAKIPEGKAGELIDRYVDVMADAGVTVFLCNTNARRTNYRSRVWEAYWDGYDPAGPDDQPFLAPMPRSEVPGFRKGIDNMLAVHKQGVDYPGRVVQRCRHHGISPWITLRMNDCHYNDVPDHPFHGNFWKKNPQLRRKNCSGYFATCLDYAAPEVRNYFKALVAESLDRYDVDGLELDFMREPYLFSAGKEAEGAPILTGWMREVRKLTTDAGARRGHPVRLGVRVPSRPEVASAMGLDALAWAREGLIDVLVPTPRWATLEFDMPIRQWRQMLGASKVTLAGGLEIRYQPWPGGPASVVTPELARGAAVSVLSQGADAVYLFNFFQSNLWTPPVYRDTLKSMASLDCLLKLPRAVGITYRDITAPGEKYHPPLPATGKEVEFSMRLGPIPDNRWPCELLLGLATPGDAAAPTASVNGKPCDVRSDTMKDGLRLVSFGVPATALAGAESHQVKLATKDQKALTIRRVEMSLREPNAPPFYKDKMNLLVWLDDAGKAHPVKNLQDWQRRREHILANMQLVMGPLPGADRRVPLDVKEIHFETLPKLVRKKITYAATKDYRVPAYLLIPAGLKGRAPAMLCLHGTSGPRGRTAGLGADYPRYTLELAERGYVTIAPDYTLLGENQVDPEKAGFQSGTMMGIWSHMRAVDLLASLPEVDPERMGAVGVSLGGHNSLFVGAFDLRLKVIVTSSGFDSFFDYMGGNLSGWCQPRYMMWIQNVFDKDPRKMPFDFPEVLAAIAPRHLYIHAPLEDSNFRVASVKRCVAAAADVYRLHGASDRVATAYPPGGHGFPIEARQAAYQFIDRALGVNNTQPP